MLCSLKKRALIRSPPDSTRKSVDSSPADSVCQQTVTALTAIRGPFLFAHLHLQKIAHIFRSSGDPHCDLVPDPPDRTPAPRPTGTGDVRTLSRDAPGDVPGRSFPSRPSLH